MLRWYKFYDHDITRVFYLPPIPNGLIPRSRLMYPDDQLGRGSGGQRTKDPAGYAIRCRICMHGLSQVTDRLWMIGQYYQPRVSMAQKQTQWHALAFRSWLYGISSLL